MHFMVKISKFEFMVTGHYGLRANWTQLWPPKSLNYVNLFSSMSSFYWYKHDIVWYLFQHKIKTGSEIYIFQNPNCFLIITFGITGWIDCRNVGFSEWSYRDCEGSYSSKSVTGSPVASKSLSKTFMIVQISSSPYLQFCINIYDIILNINVKLKVKRIAISQLFYIHYSLYERVDGLL